MLYQSTGSAEGEVILVSRPGCLRGDEILQEL